MREFLDSPLLREDTAPGRRILSSCSKCISTKIFVPLYFGTFFLVQNSIIRSFGIKMRHGDTQSGDSKSDIANVGQRELVGVEK
jgi:hypothetical protein